MFSSFKPLKEQKDEEEDSDSDEDEMQRLEGTILFEFAFTFI